MNKFILHNGRFISKESFEESFFKLGKHIFTEEIRSIRNEIILFSDILKLIQLKFTIFNIPTPHFLKNDGYEIKRQIERFLSKNKLFKSAILKLSFFKLDNEVNYFIEAIQLDETEYNLNKNGLKIDIFDKLQKPMGSLSNLSIGSKLIWDIAQQHLKETDSDNLLIENNKDKIIEAINKNVFIIKNNCLYGISPSSGMYIDVINEQILAIAEAIKLKIIYKKGFSENDLLNAEEVFLVSITNGIEWVMGFKNKRYYNSIIKKLQKKLNLTIVNSRKDSPDN